MDELDVKRSELLGVLHGVGWVKLLEAVSEVIEIYTETLRHMADTIVVAFRDMGESLVMGWIDGIRSPSEMSQTFDRRYALHRQRKQRRVRRG